MWQAWGADPVRLSLGVQIYDSVSLCFPRGTKVETEAEVPLLSGQPLAHRALAEPPLATTPGPTGLRPATSPHPGFTSCQVPGHK